MGKKLKTYSISKRKSLVNIKAFAKLAKPNESFNKFLNSLPDILKGTDFKILVDAIVVAKRKRKFIGIGIGAHVIKCGLSPILIDLMEKGFINAIAMNGATAIHDYEISLTGSTSEDVGESIKTGRFGMTEEAANAFIKASEYAVHANQGLGTSLGRLIIKERNKYAKMSVLANAYRLNIPVTVHVAIGTDTIHMHQGISGAHLGEASMTDFRIFTECIGKLNHGVWLNIGSAVILPEVFLKAVSMARNLGYKLDSFTSANLDMIQHYRPTQNVTGRTSPNGINITGHHEIMLPLLRMAILSKS